jgi:hypothetical protein
MRGGSTSWAAATLARLLMGMLLPGGVIVVNVCPLVTGVIVLSAASLKPLILTTNLGF